MNTTDNHEEKQVTLYNIIDSYLSRFTPADDSNMHGVIIKSTDDILRELDDMAEFSANEVASVLLLRGFNTCYHHDGRHGWMMRIAR